MSEPIDQLAEANKSDVPAMASPFSGEVKLLRGLHVEETDTWHDVAKVRELNGADEEYLSELSTKDDITYTEYMSGYLDRAVVSIGTLPAAGVINKLILADRDMLFLGIVKATYGDEREVTAVCPKCGEQQDIVIELDVDFPVKGIGRDYRSPIEVQLKNGLSKFRHPNGEDTIFATDDVANTAEMNTNIIASTVITEAPLQDRLEWARDLGLTDRRKVDKAIMAATEGAGPQLEEVETRCAECKSEITLRMDWVSLLLG